MRPWESIKRKNQSHLTIGATAKIKSAKKLAENILKNNPDFVKMSKYWVDKQQKIGARITRNLRAVIQTLLLLKLN